MEVVGHYLEKVIWWVFDDHVVEDLTDHDEKWIRGFDFNFFDKDEKGVGIEGSSEFPYLLMLTNAIFDTVHYLFPMLSHFPHPPYDSSSWTESSDSQAIA